MVLIEFLDTVQLETQFDLFLAIFYLPIGHRISELYREPSPIHLTIMVTFMIILEATLAILITFFTILTIKMVVLD